MGKIKNISIGFNNINYSDEIDVGKNIYTRDYWTDILLFIDILISSGNFKPEIQKLLRKLTLEKNPSIYIIYTNCSEEDDEGNITLYKKFIETVNIFCSKVINMHNHTNDESNINNEFQNNNENENINIINCDNEINENTIDLDLIIPNDERINNHKNEDEINIKNNDHYINCNIKTNDKLYYKESNNSTSNIRNENENMDINYEFINKKVDTIDLINCEDEEIKDFVFINQKENNNLLDYSKDTKEKTTKNTSITNEVEYIINENDFFESSKIFIENIPSTLKLNNIKNKNNNIKTDAKKSCFNDEINNDKNLICESINNNDCYVKEITDESEEIVELTNNTNINKKKPRKHKYLKINK